MSAPEKPDAIAAEPGLGKTPDKDPRSLRWGLIRDLTVFCVKAGLEALRDLALIPAAIVAGIAGLLVSPGRPNVYFQQILEFGDGFDDFVDLFGREARRRREPGSLGRDGDDELRADDVFERLEQVLVDEFKRGGLTAQAKEAIDLGIDAVQEALGSTETTVESLPAPPKGEPRAE